MSNTQGRKGIISRISKSLIDFIFPPKAADDIVSENSKIVLFGLFTLVGFAVLMFASTATAKYNPDDINWSKIDAGDSDEIQRAERLPERFQQMEQVNAVYIAAISGSLALGGTLIAQLWGRSK